MLVRAVERHAAVHHDLTFGEQTRRRRRNALPRTHITILPIEKPWKASSSTFLHVFSRTTANHRVSRRFRFIIKGSLESRIAREGCEAMMKEKLASVPEIAAKIIPTDFNVGCRRPTPAPGYLDALTRKDKVTVFLDEMQEMTDKGFIDASQCLSMNRGVRLTGCRWY